VGTLTVWTRWLWLPVAVAVTIGALRRRFVGREWLLPICGLTMLAALAAQSSGIIEGRYRLPVDPIVLAALVALCYRIRVRREFSAPAPGRPA
jgi:hypothetical protein